MGSRGTGQKHARLHPDVWVGAVLLAFCGLVYWHTTSIREVPAMLSQNVPPTFFPRLVLSVIAVLGLGLLLRGIRRPAESPASIPPAVFVTATVITAAVVLMPRLGTFATTGLVSIVLPLCWGERRVLRIALLAAGVPLAVYLIFVLGLGMRFPAGPFP